MYCKGLSPFSAIQQFYQLFPKDFLNSFTSARGKEFFYYPFVEDLDIDFYFSDAYSSWKRGKTKPLMVYLENISLRRLIWPPLVIKTSSQHCFIKTIDHENVWDTEHSWRHFK